MKKFKIFIAAFILVFLISSTSNATMPEKIAIGLRFGSSAVSGASFKTSGLVVSNDISNIMLKSGSNYNINLADIYVSQENYQSISQDGIKKDESYFPYSDDLVIFKSASLKANGGNKISKALVITDNNGKNIFATSGSGNIFFTSADFSPVEIFGKKYRGGLKFLKNASSITVVNYLNMEEYLMGVVPNEMSASWNIEALKAQAVAARSFAYSNYSKFTPYGFNLTSDTRSQVYGGYNTENERSNQAVAQTKGIVGYYNRKIAQLIYNASSGGKTESSANVWGGNIPYLIAQNDPYSINNPYQNWSFSMTATEIENVLKSRGKNIGNLVGIRLDEVSPNGYILKITFVGDKSSVTFSKDNIRASLGYSKLKSLYFGVSATYNNTYVFTGNGYGHGVGMSQYGAKTMADAGYNYKSILLFYYPNISLGQI